MTKRAYSVGRLRGVGLPGNGTVCEVLESITADELVLALSDGTRETWTRAHAETG